MKIIKQQIIKWNFVMVLLLVCAAGCVEKFDETQFGNCTDGKQNQNEVASDCGGPCLPCSNCEDGVKNGSETGIDCGGSCGTCTAPCSISAETISYQLNGSTVSMSQPFYGKGYYKDDIIDIDFSGSGFTGFTRMTLQFAAGVNPIKALAPGQQMVLRTIWSYESLKPGRIDVEFYGNMGGNFYRTSLDGEQSVYITRLTAAEVYIQFCSLKAGKDIISLAGTSR